MAEGSCPDCGAAPRLEASYCEACGADLAREPAEGPPGPPVPRPRRRVGLRIAGVVGAIAVIATIIFVVNRDPGPSGTFILVPIPGEPLHGTYLTLSDGNYAYYENHSLVISGTYTVIDDTVIMRDLIGQESGSAVECRYSGNALFCSAGGVTVGNYFRDPPSIGG